ncbi:MAG TPA: hypothetical protein DD723_01050 [Candidatus Omnitrophica bacterium]|nr:MAG: hypothetical protein A2Z81_02375 [Omnitrophica WOR_2 bacterium GWA2_45_18]OGX19140.1 MAG: hypothetical protein A2Y04_06110 [Omnitrophica WOR_2 bacterium GWC2_45_7]HBR14117.1 hypothetical protein [Candidatus Omnitrophota bacterium]
MILGVCFGLMAIGLIFARKVLQKGCSLDPSSCTCRKESSEGNGKTPHSSPRSSHSENPHKIFICKNKDRGK